MTSSSVKLKEPIAKDGALIGSFYSGKSLTVKAGQNCLMCKGELLPNAKFCGECGFASVSAKVNTSINANLSSDYLNEQRAQVVGLPNFAQISPQMRKAIPAHLKEEYCKLSCLLARERAFLIIHYALFLLTNLFGLWCAFKAYNDLNADEMTRAVVAFIPIICINAIAFACFVCIKGTRGEVNRLKERLTYLHYQMEYTNLA